MALTILGFEITTKELLALAAGAIAASIAIGGALTAQGSFDENLTLLLRETVGRTMGGFLANSVPSF